MRINIALARTLAAALAVAASGCGSVGSGSRLESLQIVKLTGVLGPADHRAFVCFRDAMQLVGTFTNGLQGDFTSRAHWSSSDPAVAEVSNRDIVVPGDDPTLVFDAGTVIPRGEGVATIRASYVGLLATYDVTVKKATKINVTPAAQTLAPHSIGLVQVVGVFDGYTVDITTAPQWSFDVPDDTIATISPSSGSVLAIAPSTTSLTARPKFATCESGPVVTDAAGSTTTGTVTVTTPTSLTLQREFGGTSGDLILQTSDALKAIAGFPDGTTQDLSVQSRYTIDPLTVATSFISAPNIIQANAAGTATVSACFDPDPTQNDTDPDIDPTTDSCIATDPNRLVSNTVTENAVAGTLMDVAINPTPTAVIDALRSQKFSATGTFDGARTQDITRHVVWATSDTTIAVASNAPLSAGLVFSLKAANGSVDVTATNNAATGTKVATSKLCIYTPETVARPCPP